MKKLRKVGMCHYCRDPIYDFQEVSVRENDKKYYYHSGCYHIELEENKAGHSA